MSAVTSHGEILNVIVRDRTEVEDRQHSAGSSSSCWAAWLCWSVWPSALPCGSSEVRRSEEDAEVSHV